VYMYVRPLASSHIIVPLYLYIIVFVYNCIVSLYQCTTILLMTLYHSTHTNTLLHTHTHTTYTTHTYTLNTHTHTHTAKSVNRGGSASGLGYFPTPRIRTKFQYIFFRFAAADYYILYGVVQVCIYSIRL
jgi:hypothetical protein